MRIAVVFFALVTGMLVPARAQEHLEPEPGLFAEYDRYHDEVRQFFEAAQKEGVICQVIVLASFVPEQCIGLRKSATGHEVVSVTAASQIWDLEIIRSYESGQTRTLDKEGKTIPLEKDESYQELKKRVPADFRQIKSEMRATAIDNALAGRIAKIWERMILASRYPNRPRNGLDGTSYHFSMYVLGYGIISGQTWSPDEKTKTAALVDLVDALSDYSQQGVRGAKLRNANGVDAAKLKKIVERVEKVTKG